eukprot:602008_1
MATKSTNAVVVDTPQCVCGRDLKMSIFKPASLLHTKWCDGCLEKIIGDGAVYTCPTKNGTVGAHPSGYDLCTECATKNSAPPSNAACNALIQMGFGLSESFKAMKEANGNLAEALKLLAKKSVDEGQGNNLNNTRELQQYRAEIRSLKSQVSAAKNEVFKLLDEKKEMEILICKLKEENNELKKKNINTSAFLSWKHEEILLWILSIDDGFFDKYSNSLQKELQDCELCGTDLDELTTKDIRGLGVKKFSDAKKIGKMYSAIDRAIWRQSKRSSECCGYTKRRRPNSFCS